MKAKKNTLKKEIPKGFTLSKSLKDKYLDQPLFKEKVDRANHILKVFGLPKA